MAGALSAVGAIGGIVQSIGGLFSSLDSGDMESSSQMIDPMQAERLLRYGETVGGRALASVHDLGKLVGNTPNAKAEAGDYLSIINQNVISPTRRIRLSMLSEIGDSVNLAEARNLRNEFLRIDREGERSKLMDVYDTNRQMDMSAQDNQGRRLIAASQGIIGNLQNTLGQRSMETMFRQSENPYTRYASFGNALSGITTSLGNVFSSIRSNVGGGNRAGGATDYVPSISGM